MVKIYKQPFAHDGDAIAIPDASQPDGKMSSVDGWTPDYQLPKTDPNYKPVGRQEMNGVFKEVTEALGQVQVQGAASWSADGAPYPINAQVYHSGKQWIALRANSVEPTEGEDWSGALRPATAEQAQALTAGDVAITPETLGAAMNSHVPGMGQTRQNVTASRVVGTNYANTTGRPIEVGIVVTSGSLNTVLSSVFYVDDNVESQFVIGLDNLVLYATHRATILPGETYRLGGSISVISRWEEVR